MQDSRGNLEREAISRGWFYASVVSGWWWCPDANGNFSAISLDIHHQSPCRRNDQETTDCATCPLLAIQYAPQLTGHAASSFLGNSWICMWSSSLASVTKCAYTICGHTPIYAHIQDLYNQRGKSSQTISLRFSNYVMYRNPPCIISVDSWKIFLHSCIQFASRSDSIWLIRRMEF